MRRAAVILAAGLAACAPEPEPAAPLAGAFAGRPVLVTLIDAAAAGHVGAYGYDRGTTPAIDALATEGVLFERAIAPAPYTLASVASLMTGELVDVHRVIRAGDPLPDELPLLAELAADAGYRTVGLSTNAHVHERFGFARGFEEFEFVDPHVETEPHHVVPERLLERLGAALDATETDPRPLFAYVHLMPPHAPYDPPASYRDRLAPGADPRLGSLEVLSALTVDELESDAAQRESIVELYDAGMRYVDDVLGGLRADLARRGLLDEVVWVVLSDHGEAFGEHGFWQHSATVHETLLRVPLVLRLPGGRLAGARIPEPVSLADLRPTLAELLGLVAPPPRTTASLVPLLEGRALVARPPIVSRTAGPGPYLAIRRDGLKATVHTGSRRWSLHDVEADPLERRDLARARPAALDALREELEGYRERWRRGGPARERVPLTDEQRASLEAIGYVVPAEGDVDAAEAPPLDPDAAGAQDGGPPHDHDDADDEGDDPERP